MYLSCRGVPVAGVYAAAMAGLAVGVC